MRPIAAAVLVACLLGSAGGVAAETTAAATVAALHSPAAGTLTQVAQAARDAQPVVPGAATASRSLGTASRHQAAQAAGRRHHDAARAGVVDACLSDAAGLGC
jgi:xanthine/uracil permease